MNIKHIAVTCVHYAYMALQIIERKKKWNPLVHCNTQRSDFILPKHTELEYWSGKYYEPRVICRPEFPVCLFLKYD